MKKKTYTVKHSRGRSRNAWGREPGYRASRLAETRRARRRRRFMMILLAGAAAAVLLFAAVFFLVRSRGGDSPGTGVAPGGGDVNSVLVAINNSAGELDQLLILAVDGDGAFRVVSIPARTVAEVPGRGFMTMRAVAAAGDSGGLDQTVADLLQYPVQYHVTLDYETLLLAAEQVGTINLNLRQEVTVAVGDTTVKLATGDNPMESDRAVSLLGAAAGDVNAGPAVQASFFQGLRDAFLARSATDRQAFAAQLFRHAATDLDEDQFIALFLGATAGDGVFTVSLLPVRPAGSGEDWYFEPVPGEVATILGNRQAAPFTLEVRNGTETAGVAEDAAARLAPLGFTTTVQTETSRVNFEFTQIRYGSDAAKEGNRARELLGAGTLIKDDYLEKNHIIVIIGLDLAAAWRGPQ